MLKWRPSALVSSRTAVDLPCEIETTRPWDSSSCMVRTSIVVLLLWSPGRKLGSRRGRLPPPHEGEGPMPRRPHLHGLEARLTDHLSKSRGMVPPGPETQHAEEMADPLLRRRPEVYRHQAPGRTEHAVDLSQPSTLQLIGEMVEHQAAQDHIETLVRRREGFDHPDLEARRHAGAGRPVASQLDHLRGGVDPADLAPGPCRGG